MIDWPRFQYLHCNRWDPLQATPNESFVCLKSLLEQLYCILIKRGAMLSSAITPTVDVEHSIPSLRPTGEEPHFPPQLWSMWNQAISQASTQKVEIPKFTHLHIPRKIESANTSVYAGIFSYTDALSNEFKTMPQYSRINVIGIDLRSSWSVFTLWCFHWALKHKFKVNLTTGQKLCLQPCISHGQKSSLIFGQRW